MLSDRQNYILSTIIELYEKHGEPIGSKTLLSVSNLDYSSATIRNEMKIIEENGLIEKTHTSSGRVPTSAGYRHYANQLIGNHNNQDKVADKKRLIRRKNIYDLLGQSILQIEDIVNSTASILSQLTSYTAIVLGPEATNSKLVGFRFVPINERYATGIIITDSGNVDNLTFELPTNIRASDINKMVTIIENELVGLTLIKAYQKIQVIIPELVERYASTAHSLLDDLTLVLENTLVHPIHVSGRINLIDTIDTTDSEKIKLLYYAMNNSKEIAKLLANSTEKGVNVQIGSELSSELFKDFTLISTDYDVIDHGQGLIAILGPRTMPYDMTIQLMEDVADVLPDVFRQFYRDK